VAEEIAMIDILSGSRVVYGFVRGIDLLGQEVIPALKAYHADREKGNWQLAHTSGMERRSDNGRDRIV
jgi:hypothetical protein